MKKLMILGVLLISLLFIIGGCTKTNTPTTTSPTSVNSDVVPKQAGCGDKICTEAEMCDESTHKTVCPEDCGIRCGASVTITGPKCEGTCTVSGNTVTVKGNTRVVLTLENSGETSTEPIEASFRCDYADGSGLFFKSDLSEKNGYLWHDFFKIGDEQGSVNSLITGNNKLDYILDLSGGTDKAVDLACRSTFSSNSFKVAKSFNYNINFR